MKGFLIILLMLGVIGGSVYVYDPELLDIDSYLNDKPARKSKTHKAQRRHGSMVTVVRESQKTCRIISKSIYDRSVCFFNDYRN